MQAEDLRAILARLGLSQLRLAAILGVNPMTVRRWVARKEPTPIPRAVAILMRAADRGAIDLERDDGPG